MPLLLTIGLAVSLVTVALLLLTRRRSSAAPTAPEPDPAPSGPRAPITEPAPDRSRFPASAPDRARSPEPTPGTGAGLVAVVDPGPFGSRGWIVLDAERSALAWEPLAQRPASSAERPRCSRS
ncbi:hypothetical protein KZ829_40320 [Actinoplanes hulinensis]|uniref:Uncharacterized protein n=1 Tax=Actinoplanes hulinensis TaxID=1144547 RepID=A0ABS7BGG3_9ACTN|nr:hypothetical protein [Actinoplanes hulinensis]MBW6439992.1 hypothetical protein [Actinoplanes hulinensis]